MPYNIYNPNDVVSPKLAVKNVRVIYNGGAVANAYSLAVIEWDGTDVFAIRWNISQYEGNEPNKISGMVRCVGEPNSRGYPTWFVLPPAFLQDFASGKSPLNLLLNEIPDQK